MGSVGQNQNNLKLVEEEKARTFYQFIKYYEITWIYCGSVAQTHLASLNTEKSFEVANKLK